MRTEAEMMAEYKAAQPFKCLSCGRPEDDCSADPCEAVIAQRGEEDDEDEEPMKLTVEIKTGNAAMLTAADVADALRRTAAALDRIDTGKPLCTDDDNGAQIKDRNGNTVGFWSLDPQ